MRVMLTEQSGEGEGDFSPQYILEGIGWDVQNLCILKQEAWRAGFPERWGGATGCRRHSDRMAPRGTGSSRAQEWRPVERTLRLPTAGLPLGASCPSKIQETAALQRQILLSLFAQSSCSQRQPAGDSHGAFPLGTLPLTSQLSGDTGPGGQS